MAVKKAMGAEQLKRDLKNRSFQSLYILYGEEDYLKNYYLHEMQAALIEDTFAEFNLQKFEGKNLTPEMLTEAIESYPAFSEHKMIIVRDFDLYKPPAAFQSILPKILSDLPDYICLVFYYDALSFKSDKRTKMHALLDKTACLVEFAYREERELITWVKRRVHALGKDMDTDTCTYFLFLCGHSMTNLVTEIEKAAAHSTLHEIKRYNIDAVCTRVLDAVIFDLTDAVAEKQFEKAIALVSELLAQKNTEVAIFSAILRHMQRLYAAKLSEENRGSSKELFRLIGSNSNFYAQKLLRATHGVTISWLRNAIHICGEADTALKSISTDKQKIIEFALLQMASSGEETYGSN